MGTFSFEKKKMVAAVLLVVFFFVGHFGLYVYYGRNSDTGVTRYGKMMQTKDVAPYYNAILHFFGDPDLK